jgi:hypothetical protein
MERKNTKHISYWFGRVGCSALLGACVLGIFVVAVTVCVGLAALLCLSAYGFYCVAVSYPVIMGISCAGVLCVGIGELMQR